ncbi:MAG: homoserine kinase [Sphingomonadales bacterium]
MAVYTHVGEAALTALLRRYDLGAVTTFKGIAEGVENSNYFLATEGGRFILTLYEKRVAEADLPFFLALMEHLAQRRIPCPVPVHDRDGQILQQIEGRPAALITFLDGVSLERSTAQHCHGVGAALAALHDAGGDFSLRRPNNLSLAGWRRLADQDGPSADQVEPGLAALIHEEMAALSRHWPTDLPSGVIHADLFPDNVLFLGQRVSGIIDFYFACTDMLAYDLAICLNAWCFDAQHRYDEGLGWAFIQGYESVRPLGPGERQALALLARGAAMRFLLTRLHDWLNPAPGAIVRPKDPRDYAARLRFWRDRGADFFAAA